MNAAPSSSAMPTVLGGVLPPEAPVVLRGQRKGIVIARKARIVMGATNTLLATEINIRPFVIGSSLRLLCRKTRWFQGSATGIGQKTVWACFPMTSFDITLAAHNTDHVRRHQRRSGSRTFRSVGSDRRHKEVPRATFREGGRSTGTDRVRSVQEARTAWKEPTSEGADG